MEHEHGILRMTRSDAVGGGLLGMLVGDALGVPYEFSPPDRIPKSERIEMAPPAGFQRAHPWTPPGTWSDDGAQALCLLASLLHCSGLDRSEEHTSELQSLMRISYAVFCLKKKKNTTLQSHPTQKHSTLC